MDLELTTSVQYVPRVGPAMASNLKRLGIETVEDLLFYPPFRYNDFSLISNIGNIQPGETVTIRATVTKFSNFYTKTGKKIQEATVADGTGRLAVIWFNQPYMLRIIHEGDSVSLSGEASWFGHKLALMSPQYEILKNDDVATLSLHTGRIVPVYPETEGITSKWLRGRIFFVLQAMLSKIPEILPPEIIRQYHLLPIAEALSGVHFPKTFDEAKAGRDRLAFEELFLLQLRSYKERKKWEKTKISHRMSIPRADVEVLIKTLPFTLTSDQEKARNDILFDLTRPIAMNRLLEGDVGSGKTIVAAIAMYVAHKNNLQSVMMAPTQILAEQHYKTINSLMQPLGIDVGLVTGTSKPKKSCEINGQTTLPGNKETSVFVGTHALLTQTMRVPRLGLVVIDEQQRFGVEQRAVLLAKHGRSKTPHLLTMTATPIPRTMALTIFGNLDLSVLNEMPSGRQKVKTWVVPKEKRDAAYKWIAEQIKVNHGQAFIICPLIEESLSETLAAVKSVLTEYKRLKLIFKEFQVGLLHGRMKANDKTDILNKFRENKIQILVTTPVVEVGIDVPNATIMMIEASDRFGLGQLHQLRGRVGRGDLASYCLLFTENEEEITVRRLKALEIVFSGPELAELDLKLRGPGDLFGTKQHGLPVLTFANLSDTGLIVKTRQAVDTLTRLDSDLVGFPLLRQKLETSTIKMISQD